MIVSSGSHVAPCGAPSSVVDWIDGPPVIATFLSVFRPSTKPTHWPSGETNGSANLPCRDRHRFERVERADEQLCAVVADVDDVRAVRGDGEVAIEAVDRERGRAGWRDVRARDARRRRRASHGAAARRPRRPMSSAATPTSASRGHIGVRHRDRRPGDRFGDAGQQIFDLDSRLADGLQPAPRILLETAARAAAAARRVSRPAAPASSGRSSAPTRARLRSARPRRPAGRSASRTARSRTPRCRRACRPACPRACSGTMYAAVPRIIPTPVIIAGRRDRRRLRRRSTPAPLAVPSPSPGRSPAPSPCRRARTLMFAGFRSRWMIPCSCAASSASAICLRDRQRLVERDRARARSAATDPRPRPAP